MLVKRIANLLSLKSLVTIALTIVFCMMAFENQINPEFMGIYTMIMGFYFGTQATKGDK